MINLTWLQMAHPHFQEAVDVIWNCPQLDGETSYRAHRLRLGIEKTNKDIAEMRKGILNKYGKKDENGKLINDERGFIQFDKPEDHKAFEEEFTKEFSSRSMDLKINKLDFRKLAVVRGITPKFWEHLEPITDNLPQDEELEAPLPEGKAS